jgi:asparagine synthase (glutamine-hydrolysing)
MCGIVGTLVFQESDFKVSGVILNRMRDTMIHRGPDGSGSWISEDARVGLAHRRLSIIDLSNLASQPMANEGGSLQVVFNGEIYNHDEIREKLRLTGKYKWKTDHSDTEVILHAFEEWGIDCIRQFRGMFAIAIWDAKKKELWLIRDRIGVKPLYYAVHHGRIIFASEIKALLEDPDFVPAVCDEAFYHYLSFLTTPAPLTMFEGVHKLAGGTWLRVSQDGSMQEHRYWELWDHVEPLDHASDEEICERLRVELRTAVSLRKVSDVPIGVFLSGGIDSSTNAVLFSEGEELPVKTFTIGYAANNSSYENELHHARRVANMVGAVYHEKILNIDDMLDFLPEMVRLQDEPIADPVCVPLYYVSKLARDNGIVVCQLGEGADELFWGYPGWKRLLELQHFDNLPFPRFIKKLGLFSMKFLGRELSFSYERLRRSVEGQPVFWGGAEAFTETHKQKLLSVRMREKFSGFSSWDALKPIHKRFINGSWEKSSLAWMSYLDLNLRLPELLLMRVDKMAMAASLEGRVPFLDHKFVEFAMAIPERIKTRHGVLKSILKKAVRGLIPDNIIDLPKQGFGVPLHDWFFERLEVRARVILDDFCQRTDFFDHAEVIRLFEQRESSKIWYLLNFAMWHNYYVKK